MARGDVAALSGWSPAQAIDALQKLCHDVWVLRVGGAPRFFQAQDLPAARAAGASKTSLYALGTWSRELASSARSAEHPFNAGLMLEALTSRARQALLTD
jgi:DNA polymerase-3 subunit delta'